MPGTAQEILTILVSDGKLTKSAADEINTEAINADVPIESILLKRHLITETDFAKARAKSLDIPFLTLADQAISPDVVNYIPEPVARKYVLVPVKFDSKTGELHVAMEDPLDFQVLEFLEKKSGKKVRPCMAMKEDILSAIDATYTQGLGDDVSAALKETAATEVKTYEAGKLGEVIREAPIAQIVSAALEQAMRLRSSDIHIEPQPGDTRVRYRVDGILQERLTLPRRLHDAVVSRIKILSDMKIDEKRIPQDGRFNFKMGDKEVDLRVSTLPTVHGEKVVMRLLKKSGGVPTLPELGLRGLALKNLETNMLRPHGIILVTGPTGSGEVAQQLLQRRRLDAEPADVLLGRVLDPLGLDEEAPRVAVIGREDHVVLDGHAEREAEALAVLGEVADPVRHRIPWRADHGGPAEDLDRPALRLVGAKNCPRGFRASGPHEPGKSEDLSPAEFEAHVPDRVAGVQVPDAQHHFGIRRDAAAGLGLLVDHAADHHVDDVLLRDLGDGARSRSSRRPAARSPCRRSCGSRRGGGRCGSWPRRGGRGPA